MSGSPGRRHATPDSADPSYQSNQPVLGEERLLVRQLSRRKFVVYSLAASTLTVAAPLGCDTSTAEGVEPTTAGTRRPSASW